MQIGWTVAGALALLAVLHRFGLNGWLLSLVGTAVIFFVEPVVQTLAFGQLGIFLVALVVLDLAPGTPGASAAAAAAGDADRRRGRDQADAGDLRALPAGWCGAAGPSWSRSSPALAVTLASAVIVPQASYEFWARLAHGDTGLGHSIIYYTNQSVMADVVRIFGLGRSAAARRAGGCAPSSPWSACGPPCSGTGSATYGWRSTCAGVAGLLASPVSWLHHFVWIVPLALSLAERRRDRGRARLPRWFLVLGWVFVGWVVAAPFRGCRTAPTSNCEWTWSQHLLASVTAILGVSMIIGAIVIAQRHRLSRRRLPAQSGLRADEPDHHGSPPQ